MTERWSAERANAWYAEQPWLVGCNYVPSSAINQLEMWGGATFDAEANERELGWAAGLGMNTVRVYLHDLVWRDDEAGFTDRIERFLDIAHGHGIRPLLVVFDDCWYEPEIGVPEPRPGLHNSGWLRSPGRKALEDRSEWGRLEDYVRGLIDAFGRDERVLGWDVYNEVRNEYLPIMSKPQPQRGVGMAATAARQRLGRRHSDELLEAAFGWARAQAPTQPLTAGVYYPFEELNEKLTSLSDVISFHCYTTVAELEEQVAELRKHDRPLMCTEWMSRQAESTPERFLPVFEREKIACYNWGLVDGKTQTKFSWQDRPGKDGSFSEPDPWFHDLLRPDGAPYRQQEARLFRELTGRGGAARAQEETST